MSRTRDIYAHTNGADDQSIKDLLDEVRTNRKEGLRIGKFWTGIISSACIAGILGGGAWLWDTAKATEVLRVQMAVLQEAKIPEKLTTLAIQQQVTDRDIKDIKDNQRNSETKLDTILAGLAQLNAISNASRSNRK